MGLAFPVAVRAGKLLGMGYTLPLLSPEAGLELLFEAG